MQSRRRAPTTAMTAFIALLAVATAAADEVRYPESRRGVVVDTWHGTRVADPYRWLEATDSAEVRAWIAAQNRYASAFLHQDAQRDAIRARIEALGAAWPTDGVPVQAGDYFYLAGIDPATSRPILDVREGRQGQRRA